MSVEVADCSTVCVDLCNKQITHLPKSVFQCKNLRMLCLDGNLLQTLPDELFTSLNRLTWLDVRNNKLQQISPKIGQCKLLETLLLQNNLIQQLPIELGLVPNLKTLQLSNNPIIYPSPDILQLGISGIIQYLKDEYNELNPMTEEPMKVVKKRVKKTSFRRIQSSKDLNDALKMVAIKNSDRYLGQRDVLRKRESELKQIWSNNLQVLLERQAAIIQRRKTIEALKEWRRKVGQFQGTPSTTKDPPPFDIDENYMEMPTKMELRILNSTTIRKEKPQPQPESTLDLNGQINDIIKSIKALDSLSTCTLTPAQEQKMLEVEIKKLNEIQKSLRNLKLTNDINLI